MSAEFVQEIAKSTDLSDAEAHLLRHLGVRSWEEVHSLATSFPTLGDIGVDLSKLQETAHEALAPDVAQFHAQAAEQPRKVSFGALPPPDALFTLKAAVGLPPPILPTFAPAAVPAAPIDLRIPNWPVRDQGLRGTCVSFGSTACTEVLAHAGGNYDLSEQFLYWAIKTKTTDPDPNKDGTWLRFATQALSVEGICPEADWPYQTQLLNPASGAAPGLPSALALGQASQYRPNANCVQSPPGAAAAILSILQQGRPVAVTLPVFGDPNVPNGPTNFTTAVSWQFGRVLNPPPTSVVVAGHCVCITGFAPDPTEAKGGYFIVRNSWSQQWGSQNPGAGGLAPEPGYGDISASYVDRYCWETFSY